MYIPEALIHPRDGVIGGSGNLDFWAFPIAADILHRGSSENRTERTTW